MAPSRRENPTEVLVCVTCRQGLDVPEGGVRPGAHLFDALTSSAVPDGVSVKAVECLQNCSAGCTAVLRGPGRWAYVYGNLDAADHTDLLLTMAELYHNTDDGLVTWRDRPEHFRKNCVARIPPMEG